MSRETTYAVPITFAAALRAANGIETTVPNAPCQRFEFDFVAGKTKVDIGDESVIVPPSRSSQVELKDLHDVRAISSDVISRPGANPDSESLHQSCPLVLVVASVYSRAVWDDFQLEVLQKQHDATLRLVKIEKRRILAHVDGELPLLQAELIEAQSRVRTEQLKREMQELRSFLARLLRTPSGQLDLVPQSVPGVRTAEIEDAEGRLAASDAAALCRVHSTIAGLAAVRDTSQLAYLLAERDAIRAVGLGKATIDQELSAQIRADDKFVDLLEAASELQRARFGLLASARRLDVWGEAELAESPVGEGPTSGRVEHLLSSASGPSGSHDGSKSHNSFSSLLILPSVESPPPRKSVQMAAITTGANGGKDVTANARWESTNESIAVVSSFGLVTCLRPGQTTIVATAGAATKSVVIFVKANESESGTDLDEQSKR
jgi:hypothetical protein